MCGGAIVILACAALYFRLNMKCEVFANFPGFTGGGIVMILVFIATSCGFGAMGYFWYKLLSLVGEDRLSDLFGIANRLMPPGAYGSGPMVCLPQGVNQSPSKCT